jgi:hypothetical protein
MLGATGVLAMDPGVAPPGVQVRMEYSTLAASNAPTATAGRTAFDQPGASPAGEPGPAGLS